MKTFFVAFAAICTGLTFASCSNDIGDIVTPGQLSDPTRGVTMNITKVGKSEMTNVTRATATEVNEWATAPDKNIGVSVYTSTAGTEAMKSGSVNMKWTYNTASGGWDAQTPLYFFPGDEGVVTAYYPYGESVDPKAIDIDGTKDYMYALIGDNKSVNYGAPQTSLLMHHANAQIRVNLVRRGYAGPGSVTAFSVKSSKFASSAKLNSLTGGISNYVVLPEITGNSGTLAADISVTPTAKIESAYAWFVPISDAAAPVTFDATVDGLKLRYTTDQQFESGKRYTFNLAVTDNLASELVLTSVDIDPWTDENHGGDMELIDRYNGHQYVDLGLPSGLKWAKCNVGAESETAPGLYFQWGDIWGESEAGIWAFSEQRYESRDLKKISADLTLAQDAANAKMGGEWRMPTEAEFTELYSNTNVTWTTINGVAGRKFANRTDASKYIFIPAAGRCDGESQEVSGFGTLGVCWSSTFIDSSYAIYLSFGEGWCYVSTNAFLRWHGMPVRGICK